MTIGGIIKDTRTFDNKNSEPFNSLASQNMNGKIDYSFFLTNVTVVLDIIIRYILLFIDLKAMNGYITSSI